MLDRQWRHSTHRQSAGCQTAPLEREVTHQLASLSINDPELLVYALTKAMLLGKRKSECRWL